MLYESSPSSPSRPASAPSATVNGGVELVESEDTDDTYVAPSVPLEERLQKAREKRELNKRNRGVTKETLKQANKDTANLVAANATQLDESGVPLSASHPAQQQLSKAWTRIRQLHPNLSEEDVAEITSKYELLPLNPFSQQSQNKFEPHRLPPSIINKPFAEAKNRFYNDLLYTANKHMKEKQIEATTQQILAHNRSFFKWSHSQDEKNKVKEAVKQYNKLFTINDELDEKDKQFIAREALKPTQGNEWKFSIGEEMPERMKQEFEITYGAQQFTGRESKQFFSKFANHILETKYPKLPEKQRQQIEEWSKKIVDTTGILEKGKQFDQVHSSLAILFAQNLIQTQQEARAAAKAIRKRVKEVKGDGVVVWDTLLKEAKDAIRVKRKLFPASAYKKGRGYLKPEGSPGFMSPEETRKQDWMNPLAASPQGEDFFKSTQQRINIKRAKQFAKWDQKRKLQNYRWQK